MIPDDLTIPTHTPINGYGCMCRKMTLSERDVKRLGLEVGKAPKVEHYEWVDKVTSAQISAAVQLAIERAETNSYWSFSTACKELHGYSVRILATWVHEMGHQLYFKAGSPSLPAQVKGRHSLTQYGARDDDEWFAEHFIAWLFAPKELQGIRPDIFEFITDTIKKTI